MLTCVVRQSAGQYNNQTNVTSQTSFVSDTGGPMWYKRVETWGWILSLPLHPQFIYKVAYFYNRTVLFGNMLSAQPVKISLLYWIRKSRYIHKGLTLRPYPEPIEFSLKHQTPFSKIFCLGICTLRCPLLSSITTEMLYAFLISCELHYPLTYSLYF